jgi:hypothetical protein
MNTLFQYERTQPATKLVIASDNHQLNSESELYFCFLGEEIDERVGNEKELQPISWYQYDFFNFVGYLLITHQLPEKQEAELIYFMQSYYNVNYGTLISRGMDYMYLLNGSKILLSTNELTVYSYQLDNRPIEYYIDLGIYGMYEATEQEAINCIDQEVNLARQNLTTI